MACAITVANGGTAIVVKGRRTEIAAIRTYIFYKRALKSINRCRRPVRPCLLPPLPHNMTNGGSVEVQINNIFTGGAVFVYRTVTDVLRE